MHPPMLMRCTCDATILETCTLCLSVAGGDGGGDGARVVVRKISNRKSRVSVIKEESQPVSLSVELTASNLAEKLFNSRFSSMSCLSQ